MVETKIINENPAVVHHRVSGRVSEEEVAAGAEMAMFTIDSVVRKNLRFDMIIDMRGHFFDNLNAHRIWSIALKGQQMLKENVNKIAIIGDDTPTLVTEKELLESAILQFFAELEAAQRWLRRARQRSHSEAE